MPQEMDDFFLLRQLPGYTRDDLQAEDPFFIEAVLVLLDAEAAQRKAEADKLRRRSRGR